MSKLRRLNRRRKTEEEEPPSIYGPDPGDASVEHAYWELRERIRDDIRYFRQYPNEGTAQKGRFLAEAIAPERRVLRALLAIVLMASGAGRQPPRERTPR